MGKICAKCGVEFGSWVKIDGKNKNTSHRKYCLTCSPWGKHNTKQLRLVGIDEDGYKTCSKCNIKKPVSEFNIRKGRGYHYYCSVCLYETQKNRWKARKVKLVEIAGGKCGICGYNKNLAALEFHHKNPEEKEFNGSKLREMAWATIIGELNKCVLLCANCHREIHNPECDITERNSNNFSCDNASLNKTVQVLYPLSIRSIQPTGECPVCHNPVYGTKHCSIECANIGTRKVIRPNKEELEKLISEMPWVKIGEKFGVSDNAVRKWATRYGITFSKSLLDLPPNIV